MSDFNYLMIIADFIISKSLQDAYCITAMSFLHVDVSGKDVDVQFCLLLSNVNTVVFVVLVCSADWKVRARHVLPKWRNIAALMIKTMVRMKRMPGYVVNDNI